MSSSFSQMSSPSKLFRELTSYTAHGRGRANSIPVQSVVSFPIYHREDIHVHVGRANSIPVQSVVSFPIYHREDIHVGRAKSMSVQSAVSFPNCIPLCTMVNSQSQEFISSGIWRQKYCLIFSDILTRYCTFIKTAKIIWYPLIILYGLLTYINLAL